MTLSNSYSSTATSSGWVYMGEKWGSSTALGTSGGTIKWSFADTDLRSQLSTRYLDYPQISTALTSAERDGIRTAVNTWAAVCDIDFVEVPDSVAATVRFGKSYVDGRGHSLAITTIWPSGILNPLITEAVVVFDTADQSQATDALATSAGFLSTAIHEFGHVIGLDHSSTPSAIMYPYYSGATVLTSEDISGVQTIYGAATANTTAVSPSLDPVAVALANQLFVEYLGRPVGTDWRNATADLIAQGGLSTDLRKAFFNIAVTEGVYGAAEGAASIVNKAFQNVFGFSASAFEQTAWANLVSQGILPKEDLPWTIFASYLGATNVPDTYKLPAQSRLVAAEAYTNAASDAQLQSALGTPGSIIATSAYTWLSTVKSVQDAATKISSLSTELVGLKNGTSLPSYTALQADNLVDLGGQVQIVGVSAAELFS